MRKSPKYSPEVRERLVRMVAEQRVTADVKLTRVAGVKLTHP